MTDEAGERRVAETLAFLRRRLSGDYEIDDFGFDPELTSALLMTALRPIAAKWFRIEVRGIDNIPRTGGGLVVSNHSGGVPIDALMTGLVLHDRAGRHLRMPGRRSGVHAAVRLRARPQGRGHPRLRRGRRTPAVQR